jgi:hypothetical protein
MVPFQANISDIELGLQVSLRPRITLAFSFSGISLVGNSLIAEAGASLDLPSLNSSIKQLSTTHTNSNCETSDSTPVGEAEFAKIFRNLTHIAPNVGLGVNIDFALKADVPGIKHTEFVGSTVLMTTASPLPTACLAFQKTGTAGPAFVSATAALAELKAQETAKGGNGGLGGTGEGGAKRNAAGRLSDAVAGENSRWWRFSACCIVIIAAGFAAI